MQPRGLGASAGTVGAGRSVSPNFVEDVLRVAKPDPIKGPKGEPRLSYIYGTVQIITEKDGTVVTIITR
jgi:filamentous hemagglutinin